MRDYSTDSECIEYGGEVPVLDTAAFLASIQLGIVSSIYYTTSKVIEEVRDRESRSRLDLAISSGKIKVRDPEKAYIRKAVSLIERIDPRLINALSDADLSVIALSLELRDRGCDPVLFTDDMVIHRVCRDLGLRTVGVKRSRPSNIRRVRQSMFVCAVCGYRTYRRPKNDQCPACGGRLKEEKQVI